MNIIPVADDDKSFHVDPKEVIVGISAESVAQLVVIGKLDNGELYVASSHCTYVMLELIEEFKAQLENGTYSARSK